MLQSLSPLAFLTIVRNFKFTPVSELAENQSYWGEFVRLNNVLIVVFLLCATSEISFMLNDASGFRRIYLATGYTDLRRGMEGLASIIKFNFQLDPYQKDILFLFCGRRTDRIKGLVWEGDGFLLLYKRLELGAFNWPRTKEEALEITPEQYQYLMQGLEVVARHPIQEVRPGKVL